MKINQTCRWREPQPVFSALHRVYDEHDLGEALPTIKLSSIRLWTELYWILPTAICVAVGPIPAHLWTMLSPLRHVSCSMEALIMEISVPSSQTNTTTAGNEVHSWAYSKLSMEWWSVFMGGLTKYLLQGGHNGGFNMFTSTLSKSFNGTNSALVLYCCATDWKQMHIRQSAAMVPENHIDITIPAQHVALTITWILEMPEAVQTYMRMDFNWLQRRMTSRWCWNGCWHWCSPISDYFHEIIFLIMKKNISYRENNSFHHKEKNS